MDINSTLAKELNIKLSQVEGAVKLIDEGNTIPFIARYRKEVTGSLDDQILRDLADRLEYLRNLEATREKIRETITEQGAMTEEIAAALESDMT
ncbi:MAG: Tex-like N-terminal domain-containing protein, partial [Clostridia bacterium]|nr:Tex-like N-terminal domain-containing protein [Clostridia bacterium]